jgi:hypothetical protein
MLFCTGPSASLCMSIKIGMALLDLLLAQPRLQHFVVLGSRLLLALTLASSASAYDYPLSTTAISETYFLGRRMAL